ncbi:MAG TPA: hypothetical protein VK907_07625, partial [Phnomibacter sp.]|nr:hypothetical protein [Phnomibacter sp.]
QLEYPPICTVEGDQSFIIGKIDPPSGILIDGPGLTPPPVFDLGKIPDQGKAYRVLTEGQNMTTQAAVQ